MPVQLRGTIFVSAEHGIQPEYGRVAFAVGSSGYTDTCVAFTVAKNCSYAFDEDVLYVRIKNRKISGAGCGLEKGKSQC